MRGSREGDVGRVSGPLPKNHKKVGLLSFYTGPDPLKIQRATKPVSNVTCRRLSVRQRNAI